MLYWLASIICIVYNINIICIVYNINNWNAKEIYFIDPRT
jgi:hypothetical protein